MNLNEFEYVPGLAIVYNMLVKYYGENPDNAMFLVYDGYDCIKEEYDVDRYIRAAMKALSNNLVLVSDFTMPYFVVDEFENLDYFFNIKNEIYNNFTYPEHLDKIEEFIYHAMIKSIKAFHNDFVMKEETVFIKKAFEDLSLDELAEELSIINPIFYALGWSVGEFDDELKNFNFDSKFLSYYKTYKDNKIYGDIVDDGFYLSKKDITKAEALNYGLKYLVKEESIEINDYIGNDLVLVIPYTIDGKLVKYIDGIQHKNFNELIIYAELEEIKSKSFTSIPLNKVLIYGKIGNVGENCFEDTKLRQTTINGVTYIEMNENPYYLLSSGRNTGAINVIVNENNKCIASIAFYNKNCRYISARDTEYIGSYAFANCFNLKEAKLGDGLMKLGEYAFYQCKKLERLYLNAKRIPEYCLFFCEELHDLVLGENVEILSYGAFAECDKLKELTLPASLKLIEANAFESSDIKELIFKKVCNWKVMDTDEEIDSSLMIESECARNTIFKYIDYRLEAKETILSTILTEEEMEALGYACTGGWFGDSFEIYDYTGESKEVSIPEMVGDNKVTNIGYGFLEDNENIEVLKVFADVTFDDNCFANCANLASIYFASTPRVGSGCFNNCPKVTTVYEGVRYLAANGNQYYMALGLEDENISIVKLHQSTVVIRNEAFAEKCIEELYLAEVKSVGYNAFNNCTLLNEVYIPKSIEYFDQNVFSGCTSLTNAVFEGIEKIPAYTFDGCTDLEYVELPEGVEEIGDQAFNACSSLKTMYIPDSVHTIGFYAFEDCDKLEGLVINPSNWYTIDIEDHIRDYFSDKGKYTDWTLKPSVAAFRFRARKEFKCMKYTGSQEEFDKLFEQTKLKRKMIDMAYAFKVEEKGYPSKALEYKLW